MKRIFSLITIAFLFFSHNINAQGLTPAQQDAVDKLFKTSTVVYFKFNVRSAQEIPEFAKILSVDKAAGAQVSAHATKPQFTQFIKMNYPYTVPPPVVAAKPATTAKPVATKKKTAKKTTVKKKAKKK